MKLNPDCIRDILLSVEEIPLDDSNACYIVNFTYSYQEIGKRLKGYSYEEVMYHARQCDLSGFLHQCKFNVANNGFSVLDLTPKGHEFLSDIRDNAIWNKTKSRAKDIGIGSLSALKDIAVEVVAETIKKSFGIS